MNVAKISEQLQSPSFIGPSCGDHLVQRITADRGLSVLVCHRGDQPFSSSCPKVPLACFHSHGCRHHFFPKSTAWSTPESHRFWLSTERARSVPKRPKLALLLRAIVESRSIWMSLLLFLPNLGVPLLRNTSGHSTLHERSPLLPPTIAGHYVAAALLRDGKRELELQAECSDAVVRQLIAGLPQARPSPGAKTSTTQSGKYC